MRVRYKDLSLQQLRSFRDVCRTGSYAVVARSLALSTSAVWEQIRGLERHLGVPLLENRNRTIRPTLDGERFLELVLPLLNGLETAPEVLNQLRGRPPERLTVVSGMRMLMEEISDAVCSFRRKYPDVVISMLYAEDREIEALVERGEADVAVMLDPGPGRPPRRTVAREPAYELDYLLVTPPRHPLLTKRGLRLSDVVQHPLVIGAPERLSRRRIEEVLDRHHLSGRIRVAVESNSAALTLSAVRAGAGIGITPGHLTGILSRGVGIRSLRKWFGAARYVFVWPHTSIVTPAQRELADLIRTPQEVSGRENHTVPGHDRRS